MEDQKDKRTENVGLKTQDQMSGVESARPENAGPDKQDREMVDQQPEVDYLIVVETVQRSSRSGSTSLPVS